MFYILGQDTLNKDDDSIIPREHIIYIVRELRYVDLNKYFAYSNIKYIIYLVDNVFKSRSVVTAGRDIKVISKLKYDNCERSIFCKGCKLIDYPDTKSIDNKDNITELNILEDKDYYEIITQKDPYYFDSSVIPSQRNLTSEKYKTMEEIEISSSIYDCGGYKYTIYKIIDGIRTAIYNNKFSPYSKVKIINEIIINKMF